MKIKGTGLISTFSFVTTTFGRKARDEWISVFPEETQYAYRRALATSWYPVQEMYIEPGRRLCEMFYPEDIAAGARCWGTYNAHKELTGIYKMLLKMSSPNMMVSASAKTWSFFYTEGTPDIITNDKGHAVLRSKNVPIKDAIWGHHCAGYFNEILRLVGGKEGNVVMRHLPGNDGDDFEYDISWQ